MRTLLLLYAASGLFSLAYQVLWLRHFVDRFGSSTFTFVIVICGFIGGLGAGALASRRVVERLRRMLGGPNDLALYGVVELLVAGTALFVFLEPLVPMDLLSSFPYAKDAWIWEPTLGYHLLRVPLALSTVVVPCFFMGVTYPLLCHVFRTDERFPARLYAWNTLGACSGVLACELVLIRYLGTTATLLVVALGNLVLGAFFVLRGARFLPSLAVAATEHAAAPPPVGPQADARSPGPTLGTLLTAATVSGFLSGAIESDVFRWMQFHQLFNDSSMAFVSFWAILAIFVGSFWVHRGRWTLGRIQVAYAVAFLVYAATVFLLLEKLAWWLHNDVSALATWSERFVPADPDAGESAAWRSEGSSSLTLASFLVIGLATFPAYCCVSLLLPHLCNQAQAQGRHLGRVYGLNTLAFLAGMVAFTWLAPWVHMVYAFKLCAVVFGILVVLIVSLRAGRPLGWLRPASAVVALALAVALVPRDFDLRLFPPATAIARSPVRAVKGSPGYTTFISEQPAGDVLYLGTGKMSDTTPVAKRYMRLLAHIPLLAHPDPERVLLVCFGIGNTAGAIAKHESVRALDVVDLSRNVLESAPEFALHNDRIQLDARARFVCDDGRAFLSLTDRSYDLITSEPPPPLMHGVSRLYSAEYYASVLEHLTPDGFMSQWLPVYQMPPRASTLILDTFVQAFPHALLFTGIGRELILVGSERPLDFELLACRLEELPRVRAHLNEVGLPSAKELVASLLWTDGQLRECFGEGAVVSDEHNSLSLYWPTGRMLSFPYDPWAVLDSLPPSLSGEAFGLRAIVTDFERLVSHVPRFPSDSLAHASSAGRRPVRGAELAWTEVERLQEEAEDRMRRSDLTGAWQVLEDVGRIAPGLYLPALQRGLVLLGADRPPEARGWFERAAALLPGDQRSLHLAGLASFLSGDLDGARRHLRRALELNRWSFEVRVLLARVLAASGDRDGALEQLDAAREMRPGDSEVRELRERVRLL